MNVSDLPETMSLDDIESFAASIMRLAVREARRESPEVAGMVEAFAHPVVLRHTVVPAILLNLHPACISHVAGQASEIVLRKPVSRAEVLGAAVKARLIQRAPDHEGRR